MEKENRKYERLPNRVIVHFEKISFPLGISGNKKQVQSANISPGGIAIELNTALETGDVLNMEIIIPEYYKYNPSYKYTDLITDLKINAIGTVRFQKRKRANLYETGIEFSSIDIDDRHALKRYIKLGKGE